MNINPNVSNIPDNPEISNQANLQKIKSGEVKSFKLGGTRDPNELNELQKEINALKELIADPNASWGDMFKKMMQLSKQLEGMEGADALKEVFGKIGNALEKAANAGSIGEAFKFRMEAGRLCEEFEKLAASKGSAKPFGM